MTCGLAAAGFAVYIAILSHVAAGELPQNGSIFGGCDSRCHRLPHAKELALPVEQVGGGGFFRQLAQQLRFFAFVPACTEAQVGYIKWFA